MLYRNREREVIAVKIGAGREMPLPARHAMRSRPRKGGGRGV